MRITRSLSLMLFTSIALNLLLGGLLAGQWFFKDHEHPKRAGRFDRQAAMAELSESSQMTVNRIWKEHRKKMKHRINNSIESRRHVHEILIADNFSRDALMAARKETHTNSLNVRSSVHAAIADIAEALPDEERKRYFKAGFSRLKKRLDKRAANNP